MPTVFFVCLFGTELGVLCTLVLHGKWIVTNFFVKAVKYLPMPIPFLKSLCFVFLCISNSAQNHEKTTDLCKVLGKVLRNSKPLIFKTQELAINAQSLANYILGKKNPKNSDWNICLIT